MEVHLYNCQDDVPFSLKNVPHLVESVLKNENILCDEVSIHFVSEEEICRLHLEFFDDETPTDCISFPLDAPDEPGFKILGEVFVCPKTAFHYTQIHGGDLFEEISLYIVHGLLHLAGYDDIHKADREEMRAAEMRNIALLKQQHLLVLPA